MSEAKGTMRSPLARILIGAALVSAPAWADQPAIPRIGALVSLGTSPFYEEGLREGLRKFDYIETKNIVIEWRRSAGRDEDRSLAADLARSKLDVIVVFTTAAARAALEATTNAHSHP